MSFMKKAGKGLADIIPGLGHFTFDDSPGKIFVTSGTGPLGYRVAMSLLEAGHSNIRVGVWKGDRQGPDDQNFALNLAKLLEEKGAEVVDFDWSNPAGKEAFVVCSTVDDREKLDQYDGWTMIV